MNEKLFLRGFDRFLIRIVLVNLVEYFKRDTSLENNNVLNNQIDVIRK